MTVHFKLKAADVEQNNVKGEKRFFLPRLGEIAWDEQARQLTIPFEFRPLTAQEAITYGQKNQQEAIIAQAVEAIPKRLAKSASQAMAALASEKRRDDVGTVLTHLEYHLRQYTRRNTSDFFIHKDLRGFLSRELDFYLKNEVLNLEEMETAGEGLAEGWFQLMRLIKKIGGHVIEFLAQIEDFQKMLWEKRKFVTETFYCITVGNIPEAFYPEIAACEAQWEEWKALFHIDEEEPKLFAAGKNKKDRRMAFLKAHPTLVLDTKHFEDSFADRLLGSFGDLDEMTDGLLVWSDNFQALNLLRERYRERTAYIYIDPPYNTASSEILYKNDYKHSSWLSLIQSRLSLAMHLLMLDGLLCVTVDDIELANLLQLMRIQFPECELYPVVIEYNHRGRTRSNFSLTHEYGVWIVPQGKDLVERESTVSEDIRRNLRRTGQGSRRAEAPTQFFGIEVDKKSLRIVNVTDILPVGKSVPKHHNPDTVMVWPIDSEGRERRWYYGRDGVLAGVRDGRIYAKRIKGTVQIHYWEKGERARRKSMWVGKELDASTFGSELLNDLFGQSNFTFPKSIYAVEKCIDAGSRAAGDWILDFFAGSGTTAHAAIELWRQKKVPRKFVLVEMGEYFSTILVPRIKKVIFAPEWKEGKPKRMATREETECSPRIVKVIRLESYEDSLNNIAFEEPAGQQRPLFEDYLLKYMLKWEARKSETLLKVEKLGKPFSYQLHIHRDGETRPRPVDLPETFNYLLGLDVQSRKVYDDSGRRYLVYRGATREGRRVAIIWRETDGWTEADYRRDKEFVTEQKLTGGADEVYVNGDSFISNARALEPVFKARMFAEVEA